MKPIEFYKCKDLNVHEIILRGKRIFGVDLCEGWHISWITMHGQEGKNYIKNGDEITKLNIFLERNKKMNNFTTESINGCIKNAINIMSGKNYCTCGPVYEDCLYSSIDEAIKKCPNFQPDATVMSQETYNECLKLMEDKKIEEPKNDPVNHPSHYTSGGNECIDAIKAALSCHKDPIFSWYTGQIMKYLWRWPLKNGIEDLKKAKFYLDHLINDIEKDEEGSKDGSI